MINIELKVNKQLNKINKMLLLTFGLGGLILLLIGCIFTDNLIVFNIVSVCFLLTILYLGYLQNNALELVLNENGISMNSNKSLLLLLNNKKTLIINGKETLCSIEITLSKVTIKVIK